jgi:hypothetical protein
LHIQKLKFFGCLCAFVCWGAEISCVQISGAVKAGYADALAYRRGNVVRLVRSTGGNISVNRALADMFLAKEAAIIINITALPSAQIIFFHRLNKDLRTAADPDICLGLYEANERGASRFEAIVTLLILITMPGISSRSRKNSTMDRRATVEYCHPKSLEAQI